MNLLVIKHMLLTTHLVNTMSTDHYYLFFGDLLTMLRLY